MVALLGGVLLGQASGGCLEQGELQCEEAVGRILDCCGLSEAPNVDCSHYTTSCGGEVFPEIDLAESRCIREAPCGELEARGVCAWAADNQSYAPPPSVCR